MNTIRQILLFTITIVVSSCSHGIYSSGRYSKVLKVETTRTHIREVIGAPIDTGVTYGNTAKVYPDSTYDVFLCNGPIYDFYLTAGAGMSNAMTFGLMEFVNFPTALKWRATSIGLYDVKVIYDSDLMYRMHTVKKHQTANKRVQATGVPPVPDP